MTLTDYHAKYFAYELTKRCSSDSLEKLTASLADAQVDLNPHQVEAALFAVRSPLSKGAILADEVGLGKTIEAGILLSQDGNLNVGLSSAQSLFVLLPFVIAPGFCTAVLFFSAKETLRDFLLFLFGLVASLFSPIAGGAVLKKVGPPKEKPLVVDEPASAGGGGDFAGGAEVAAEEIADGGEAPDGIRFALLP